MGVAALMRRLEDMERLQRELWEAGRYAEEQRLREQYRKKIGRLSAKRNELGRRLEEAERRIYLINASGRRAGTLKAW